MEYRSEFNIDVPQDISLPQFVLQKAASYGDRTALIDDKSGRKVTYAEFVVTCRRLAAGLYRHGIRHGDVILVFSEHCIEYPIIFYGVMICGAIVTGLGTGSTQYELEKRLVESQAKFVFTSSELYSRVIEATAANTNVQDVFTIGEPVGGCTTFNDLVLDDTDGPQVEVDPMKDVCILNYSSGTTGANKPIAHTHYSWVADICHGIHESAVTVREGCDVTLIQRPLYHGYAQIYYVTIGCYQGITNVLPPDPRSKTALELIQKYRVTFLVLSPISMNSLILEATAKQYDLSSLRTVVCAACPLPQTTYDKFKLLTRAPDIRNLFGSSETLVALIPRPNSDNISLGQVLPNGQAKIVDVETMTSLGPNQCGELLLKGPNVFIGYLNKPKQTQAAFTEDGWYKTGDIAYVDDDGNFHVKDRLKEIIKYRSTMVIPAEVENVILSHPAIHQVAVVGRPDPEYPDWTDIPVSELPTAYVVKKQDCDVTETDIHNWVKDRLGNQNHLRGGVIMTEEIPTSPSGKILRRILRDELRRQYKETLN